MSDDCFTVQVDKPLKEQKFRKCDRETIMMIFSEKNSMEAEWRTLLRRKLFDLKVSDEEEYKNALEEKMKAQLGPKKRKRSFENKLFSILKKRKKECGDYQVSFDTLDSVKNNYELVIRCLDGVVADAKRDGIKLPWFEFMPLGIRRDYAIGIHCDALEKAMDDA